MKKSLLLLFSLLIFVGNVWGECSKSFDDIRVDGWSETIDLDFVPSRITLTMTASNNTARTLSVEESSDGKNWTTVDSHYETWWGEVYNILGRKTRDRVYYSVNKNLKEGTRYIKLKSDVVRGNDFSNIVVYKKAIVSAERNTSTLTSTPCNTPITINSALSISYANPASDIKIKATSDNGTVYVSPTSIQSCKSGMANVNITYTPENVGDAVITVTLSEGATGSYTFTGKGTLPIPAKPSVTMSYKYAVVNWTPVSGADGYIVNWYQGSTKIGSYTVTGANANSYKVENLIPNGTSYSFSVQSKSGSNPSTESEKETKSTLNIPAPTNFRQTEQEYSKVSIAWNTASGAEKYHIYWDGGNEECSTNEKTYTGLPHSTSYTNAYVKSVITVNGTDYYSPASNKITVSTTTLYPPTVTTTAGYDAATINWDEAAGATSYVVYMSTNGGTSYTLLTDTVAFTKQLDNLEQGTDYYVKVQSKLNDKETTTASAVKVTTKELAASSSFTLSDATYTTCQGTWAQIPNATGYKVVASNGAVTYFEGGSTTSGTIAGLLPNNSYTCTIYGMYNKTVSKNGKTSNSINTLTTNCPTESLGSASIESQGGFNWDDKYSKTFTTSKNQATISFQFNTSTGWATGAKYFVEESADGSTWTRKSWTSTSQSGSGSVTLSRGKFKFRFVYSGNFGATISEVYAVQASYMEVSTTNIDFGNIVYGNSASQTISVPFSTMISNVTTTNQYYTFDKSSVGADDCSYGTESLKITFNKDKDAAIGEQNTTIYIGSNAITITATITLPVPVLSLSSKSYQNVVLSWDAIAGAERYKINCAGKDPIWINASDFDGSYTYGGLLQNTEYTFTVQAYGGEELTDESNAVTTTTLSLAAPTIAASNISYGSATLTWSAVDDAADYELYDVRTGKSYIFTKGTNSVAIDTLSLHTSYTYRIYSRLDDETRSLTYGSVTFNTLDLAASTSFELSNISYNAMNAAWDAVEGATGYMIRERWTKMVLTFDSNVTSTTIYGLKPGTYYEFYLYATYNDVQATDSNRISATGTTLGINCPVQVVDDHTFGCSSISSCGFDWSEKVYEITTDKNAPVLSFAFEINKYATKSAEEMTQYGPHIRVEEYTGGQWVEKWRFTRSQGSYSGSANVDNLERSTRKVRIIYKGNLDCSVTDCTISQSSYFELDKSSVPFGECYIGTPSVTQTVSADYSSQAASVVSTDTDLFTVSKETLGNGDCGYGTDEVIITANTALEPGTYNADLSVGRNTLLPMSITILGLPAPTPFEVSGTAPAGITLTWGDVNITETGYKVVCKQGETEIETKNLGGDVTTCTFEGLTPNVEYTFTITTMYNTIENGSATITGSTTQLPAPQNFNITNVLSARADASWNEVSGATGYRLTWTDGADSNGSVDLDSDVFNYVITDLIPNREYTATVATIYNGDVHGTSDEQAFTTSCVVRTAASGDEVEYQSHNIEFISGTQLADGSYLKGSVIRYTSSTSSENIRFVQINVDGTIYTTPSIEITINGNVHIESRYEYKGIAEVIDDKVYNTLNEAVEAVHDGGTINLLGDVPTQDLSVSGKHIEFNGNGHSISNLYIESDGSVDLIGDVVVVNDFGLEISTSNSGQFTQTNAQIEVRGKAYVDKAFDASGVGSADKWYSLAVPFRVSMANGMAKIVNGVESHAGQGKDIDIFVYDSEKRARTTGKLDSWVYMSANGTLEPATFYLVGITHSGPNVFRFYKDDNADLVTLNKEIELHEYPSSIQKNAGWNGIGNSQLYHVGITLASTGYAQILENNKFITIDLGESSFAVTSPMFIQSATDSKATLNYKNDGSLRSASATSATYNVRLTPEGADKYSDQMFVNASSDVTGEYRIGKDLAKFELSTSAPQIYTKAYETTLSVHEAGYNAEGYADIDLFMFAPTAGNYTLSLGKDVSDGSTLYLVKDGSAIHNFNEDGAYTLYLAKGTNSSYTLRIANGTEDVPTEVTEDTESAVKVFIKEHVLHICGLPSGEDYMVGNLTRTLYTGTSNGSTIEIPLTMQGVYWIRLEDSTIKVLNK